LLLWIFIKIVGVLCILFGMRIGYKYLKYGDGCIGIDFFLMPVLYLFGLYCLFDFNDVL